MGYHSLPGANCKLLQRLLLCLSIVIGKVTVLCMEGLQMPLTSSDSARASVAQEQDPVGSSLTHLAQNMYVNPDYCSEGC